MQAGEAGRDRWGVGEKVSSEALSDYQQQDLKAPHELLPLSPTPQPKLSVHIETGMWERMGSRTEKPRARKNGVSNTW